MVVTGNDKMLACSTAAGPETIYLAGAFGNYVDVESIQILGIFPQIDTKKIISVGNAAGSGCQMSLVNKEVYNQAINLIKQIDQVELASTADFKTLFMDSMYF